MEGFAFDFFSNELKIAQRVETHGCFESHAPLHLQAYITALRVLALAGQFGCLLRIGACIAAVILSGRRRTVAGCVFAFLCRGHESSFDLNVFSLI
jgi:hypothetical protein